MTEVAARLGRALADRYVIEREVGQGGMATVYLAHDVRHDRQVALKVLRPELASILGAERFLSEIKTTAHLQHPHILPLHDSGEADGLVFYVMPYVEGESLRDRLAREKQLPVEEAIRIATEVASALDYAHRHQVVHRDIKPENILLEEGQALVADFGIALAASRTAGGTRLTETGMSLGTPAYMAPEQAMGEKEITPKADVYALGCVLYEMLTGEPPFTGPTAQAIVARVMTEQPRSLTLQRRTIPPHVEAAVTRALEKLPADRFATAGDFAAALANPSFTHEAAAVAPAHRPGRRAWRRWMLGAAMVAVAVAGWGTARWYDVRSRMPAPAVQFALGVRPGETGSRPAIALSADGSELAWVGLDDRGRSQVMLRRLEDTDVAAVQGASAILLNTPTFSPDGSQLAFYADEELRVISVRGGGARAVAGMLPTSCGFTWTDRGRIIYQPRVGGGLFVVNASGGDARPLTRVDTARGQYDHRWPQALPGGRDVVFTIWRGSPATASIGIASSANGVIRELMPGFYPRYGAGYLMFATADSTLQAVPFDPARGLVRGAAVTIADRVAFSNSGFAYYDASLSGTLILLEGSQKMTPVMVDLSGSATDVGMPPGVYEGPRFSPRGDALSVGWRGNVWLRDLRLGTFGPLTAGGGFYPLWSRDGRWIYFSSYVGSDVHVFRVPADRSTEAALILTGRGQFRTQAISPDGRVLLLRVNAAGDSLGAGAGARRDTTGSAGAARLGGVYDLWAFRLDSSVPPQPWLATAFVERSPAFSPDGRWVAYSSDESGVDEVYVRPFAGPGGRIQVSTEGGTEPAWTPDGRGLIYRSGDRFMMAPVRLAPAFTVLGSPRVLFRGEYFSYPWDREYDIHPDGHRLVALRLAQEETELRVLVNWVPRATLPTVHHSGLP